MYIVCLLTLSMRRLFFIILATIDIWLRTGKVFTTWFPYDK